MRSPENLPIGFLLLLVAVVLASLVTVLDHIPAPGTSASSPVDRLEAFHAEYAEEGSCEWRQLRGAPRDLFPIVLRVALLAYPAVLGAAVGFMASVVRAGRGRSRALSALGLVLTALVGVWLFRIGFVRAALELC